VKPTGSRYWRFKYRINGKEMLIGLRVYPDVPLKLTRERREEARRLVASGIDPSAKRQAPSGEDRDVGHLRGHRPRVACPAKHQLSLATFSKAQWTFETLIFPRFGDLPISAIKCPTC